MIVQNEINLQGELANETHNQKISDKHRKERILAQNNGDRTIIWYPREGEKHTWQDYVTSELK